MATLQTLFEQFLRERRYLKNVSPKTRVWYETAWKTFLATQPAGVATAELNGAPPITRQHLHVFVVALRDRGVRPVTVNTWLRALNAFCRWLHEEGVLREPTKLKPLKLKRRFVKTLDDAALKAVLTFKPKGYSQWRVHAAVSTILDTGCRIDEVLSARVRDFDFHNLLLTVVGKGEQDATAPAERIPHVPSNFERASAVPITFRDPLSQRTREGSRRG
jgi:integrase/recombinase XerD